MGEQVRYGLVGTGMMGVEHLNNLAITPGAVVTAIADPVSTSLGWAKDALGERADGVRSFDSSAALAASVLCAVLGGGNAAAVLLFLAAAGLFLRDMHLTGSRLGAELCGHAALAFLLAMLLEAYGLAGRFALLTMVGFFLVSLGMRLGVTALRDAFLPGCAR